MDHNRMHESENSKTYGSLSSGSMSEQAKNYLKKEVFEPIQEASYEGTP